jgi:cytochrome c oxidase assembly factor CtaG
MRPVRLLKQINTEGESALHEWSFPIPLTTFLVLVVVCYVRGWLHLRKAFPRLTTLAHLSAFAGGIISIFIAVGSPLAVMDHELLSVHMVQHLLLMAVAPPFVLLGSPVPALLHGLPKRLVRGGLGPFLRSPLLRHLGRFISHPAFCWLAATLTVIGWHLPSLFALGLHSPSWHEIQHVSFLFAGFLFWWPVVPPWPSASRSPGWSAPLYLFLATLPCDALSAFLTFCGRVVYPSYLSAAPPFQVSALQDQEWAGVLMWVSITFIYMVPALVLTVRLLSPAGHTPKKAVALRLSPYEISRLPRRGER